MNINGLGFLQNMTTPIAVGDRVDVHVIPSTKEPEPDYEAMRRVVAGRDQQKINEPASDDSAG